MLKRLVKLRLASSEPHLTRVLDLRMVDISNKQ